MHEGLVGGQPQALLQRIRRRRDQGDGTSVEPGQRGIDVGGGLEFIGDELQGDGASRGQFGREVGGSEGVLGVVEPAGLFDAAMGIPVPVQAQLEPPTAASEVHAGGVAIRSYG